VEQPRASAELTAGAAAAQAPPYRLMIDSQQDQHGPASAAKPGFGGLDLARYRFS